jgi:hypothetical protein
MLDRWEAADVADEPDWTVIDVEPLALALNLGPREAQRSTSP